MKLLAIDCSAKTASVAVLDGKTLVSECFVNAGLTHSRTLMPMVDNTLSQCGIEFDDIDALAVSSGPGSFTGVRIGISAIKGLAFPKNLPCSGISTLEAMAYNFTDEECVVCSLMDARRSQVYTALFKVSSGKVERLTEDSAQSAEETARALSAYEGKVYLCGDGAPVCADVFKELAPNAVIPDENRRYQRAYGVGLAALESGKFIDSALLEPGYIRPSQAERELSLKKKGEEL